MSTRSNQQGPHQSDREVKESDYFHLSPRDRLRNSIGVIVVTVAVFSAIGAVIGYAAEDSKIERVEAPLSGEAGETDGRYVDDSNVEGVINGAVEGALYGAVVAAAGLAIIDLTVAVAGALREDEEEVQE